MSTREPTRWRTLEAWSPHLFLVGGALVAVFAALLGVEAFMDTTAPEDIFGPAGFAVAFVGLLGLYPELSSSSRWLAGGAAVFAVLGALGGAATSAANIAQFLGLDPPSVLRPLSLGIFLGMLGGFPLFSAAILRSEADPRAVGLLLLGPPFVFSVMLTGVLKQVMAVASARVVLSSALALAILALGFGVAAAGTSVRPKDPAARSGP